MIYMIHPDGAAATIEHQRPLGLTIKECMEDLGWFETDKETFDKVKSALEDDGVEPEETHYNFQPT